LGHGVLTSAGASSCSSCLFLAAAAVVGASSCPPRAASKRAEKRSESRRFGNAGEHALVHSGRVLGRVDGEGIFRATGGRYTLGVAAWRPTLYRLVAAPHLSESAAVRSRTCRATSNSTCLQPRFHSASMWRRSFSAFHTYTTMLARAAFKQRPHVRAAARALHVRFGAQARARAADDSTRVGRGTRSLSRYTYRGGAWPATPIRAQVGRPRRRSLVGLHCRSRPPSQVAAARRRRPKVTTLIRLGKSLTALLHRSPLSYTDTMQHAIATSRCGWDAVQR